MLQWALFSSQLFCTDDVKDEDGLDLYSENADGTISASAIDDSSSNRITDGEIIVRSCIKLNFFGVAYELIITRQSRVESGRAGI